MKWTADHDLELVKEILAERPFEHAKSSWGIGIVWQKIVDNLNERKSPTFTLKSIRAVRERYQLLEKNFKRKSREEENATGIAVGEPSEFDRAIEEVVTLFDSHEDVKEKRTKQRQKKKTKLKI